MAAEALSDAERRVLQEQLVDERQHVERRLAALVQSFDDLVAAADLEPPDDEHDPDGTTAYERAQFASMAEASRLRLTQIDRALAQLADGRYGTCETCGQPIGEERLAILPSATRCVTCAAGN
ncbi:MAG: TraR/DksA C4-type zinc finger protein [Acidimicrobiia bacterium]|nr:TraR/DksA C4-type zinc finger protein [Acidimicrobiia bacterium]